MSERLAIHVKSLILVIFFIMLASFLSKVVSAQEYRVLVDDFKLEEKVKKVKENSKIKRPKACICSNGTKLERISEGSTSLKGYLWNCRCGINQCLITTGNRKFGDTAITCNKY